MNEPIGPVRRLKTKEAAAYLGVSPRTLEKYRVTGGGPPFHKVFTRVVYDAADLDEWLQGCRRSSTSDGGRAENG